MKTKNIKVLNEAAAKYERFRDMLDQIDPSEIELFKKEVQKAFNMLTIDVHFVDYDPYKNLFELSRDIFVYNRMKVSSLHNESRLLPGDYNLKFRAVHDFLHYFFQQPFGFEGELEVYKVQKRLHSTKIGRKILFSEVVMQAAYCEKYGKFPEKQKVII